MSRSGFGKRGPRLAPIFLGNPSPGIVSPRSLPCRSTRKFLPFALLLPFRRHNSACGRCDGMHRLPINPLSVQPSPPTFTWCLGQHPQRSTASSRSPAPAASQERPALVASGETYTPLVSELNLEVFVSGSGGGVCVCDRFRVSRCQGSGRALEHEVPLRFI